MGRFMLPISIERLRVDGKKEEGGKIEEWNTLSKGIEEEVQVGEIPE